MLVRGAPPCKEYSRLKLRPGGPKALRMPEYMDGVPDLTPSEREKVRDSSEIHRRGRLLLHATFSKGGVRILEQPPSSLAWLEPAKHGLFQELQGHIAWVDACHHGSEYAKSWAFASSAHHIKHMAPCPMAKCVTTHTNTSA